MKTSNWWYVFFFLLGGIAMVAAQNMLFVKATAQQPPAVVRPTPPLTAESRVIVEQRPDGTVVHRTVEGKILQTFDQPAGAGNTLVPMVSADGRRYYTVGVPADPEAAKLMQEEAQVSQEAQTLVANLRAAGSDGDKVKIKTQLREKLVAIFDMQQNRRAAEVAKIEERLARLKDTMKKRDTAKDSIVDRRLDVLTGGVDELGWEETFPLGGPNAARGYPVPSFQPYGVPTVEPRAELPAPMPRPNTPAVPVPGLR